MSMRVPNDTVDVLESLVKAIKRALPEIPMPDSLLITGAVIDAENLLAEIKTSGVKL